MSNRSESGIQVDPELQSDVRALTAVIASVVTFLVTGAIVVSDVVKAIELKEVPHPLEALLGIGAVFLFSREAARQANQSSE